MTSKPTLNQAWAIAEANPGQVVEFSPEQVVCDYCATDHTHTEDVGGVVLGSSAICPTCCDRLANEMALDRADFPEKFFDAKPGERFGEMVRRFRAERCDGPPTVQIQPAGPPGPRMTAPDRNDMN